MKTILVTGAAGFIGSHVSETLLARGDTVIGLDELNDYYSVENKQSNLKLLSAHDTFTFVQEDLRNLAGLTRVFETHKITHVAHLAARAGVRPSIQEPLLYEEVNVKGSLHLLELARKHPVENFVLTSSSSVYGNSTSIPFRENDSLTEKPVSPYAATKKASELLAHTYHHLYGIPINVVRPFTVYGPRGRPDMAPWIFMERALTGGTIKKFGDGTTRRDYTFIDDFVKGFVSAIDTVCGFEIFNLGNSATVSLNDAIATIEDVSGKKLRIEVLPMQPGDVVMTNADISKASEKLGYRPTTSFREGMQIFHDWFIARSPQP